ncbi:hypothetical protein D3C77_657070 [compost metagenome]
MSIRSVATASVPMPPTMRLRLFQFTTCSQIRLAAIANRGVREPVARISAPKTAIEISERGSK